MRANWLTLQCDPPGLIDELPPTARIYVDGIEVKQVCSFDSETGELCTYDVLGDGEPHSIHQAVVKELLYPPDLKGEVLYRTLRGKITILVDGTPYEGAHETQSRV